MLRIRQGQHETENRAPARIGFGPYFSIMRLDDRTGNRQAYAHAARFACRERFEKILLNHFGESNTSYQPRRS